MKKIVMLMVGILAMAFAGSALAAGTTMFAVQNSGGTVDNFSVDTSGKTIMLGTQVSTVGVGKDAVGHEVNPTLVAGTNSDWLYGLRINPTVNANGFTNPLLYSLHIPGNINGIVRFKFDNTNAGTAAQTGIEMNNNVGQALITFYGSNYSTPSLQNFIYYKNAVGGMKFLGFTGSSIGFGIGTAAANANALTIDSSNRINLGTVPVATDGANCLTVTGAVGTICKTATGTLVVAQ